MCFFPKGLSRSRPPADAAGEPVAPVDRPAFRHAEAGVPAAARAVPRSGGAAASRPGGLAASAASDSGPARLASARAGAGQPQARARFRSQLDRTLGAIAAGRAPATALRALAQAQAALGDAAAHEIEADLRAAVRSLAPKTLARLLARMGEPAFGALQVELRDADDALRWQLRLQEAAHREAFERGEADLRAKAVATLARPGAGERAIARTLRAARDGYLDLCESLGAPAPLRRACDDFARDAVARALATLAPPALAAALAGASSLELADVKDALAHGEGSVPAAVSTALGRAVAARTQALRGALDAATRAVPAPHATALQQPGPRAQWRARLAAASKAYDDLRAHGERHALRDVDLEDASAAFYRLASGFVEATTPLLQALPTDELLALAALAQQYDVAADAVLEEIAHRRGAVAEWFQQALQRFAGAVLAREPAAAVRWLAELAELARTLRGVDAAQPADAHATDALPLLAWSLQQLAPADLEHLQRELAGPFGRDALRALGAAAAAPHPPSDEACARAALAASMLEQVMRHVDRLAPARAADAAAPASEAPPATTSAALEHAVAAVFGVALPLEGPDVRRGVFEGPLRAHLVDESVGLGRPSTTAERMTRPLPGGMAIGLQCHDAAMQGLDLRLPDGRPLLPGGAGFDPPEAKRRRLAAGIDELVAHFGGDARARAQVTALTLRASDECFEPFVQGFELHDDESNPARMHDVAGNPLAPHRTAPTTRTITFLRGPGGEPRMRLDLERRGGAFAPADGRAPIVLDGARSCVRTSVLLELVDNTGRLRVVGAPGYEIRLVASANQKSYPLPGYGNLYGADGIAEARRDLAAHARARGGHQLVEAAHALQQFAETPTLERAERAAHAAGRAHDMLPEARLDEPARLLAPTLQPLVNALRVALDVPYQAVVEKMGPIYASARLQPGRARWPQKFTAVLVGEQFADCRAALSAQPGTSEMMQFLEACNELRRNPSVIKARTVFERWIKRTPRPGNRTIPLPLDQRALDAIERQLAAIASQLVDPRLFEAQQQALQRWTVAELPGFHAALREGKA